MTGGLETRGGPGDGCAARRVQVSRLRARRPAPGPPRIRTCGFPASGSSVHGFAARSIRHPDFFAIRCCFVETVVDSAFLPSVPPAVPCSGAPFPPLAPHGVSSPTSSVLRGAPNPCCSSRCRFALRSRPGTTLVRLSLPAESDASRRGQGCSPASPTGFEVEATGPPRFLSNPLLRAALSDREFGPQMQTGQDQSSGRPSDAAIWYRS